jgi:peptide/nickel transport system ATP-binding protein
MNERAATLSVQGLTIDYRSSRGPVRAARDVSFEVGHGDAIGLIGESGSGKSTIALAIMGLLPANARIEAGRIEYQAPDVRVRDVLRLSDRELRAFRWSACAMVPQGAISSLNPVMRVAEHFADTAEAHRHPGGASLERRARELFESVHLDPERVWRAYPHELSGGMRQRVLIALALLLSPQVLILDEPTTALDILTQRSILDVLGELRRTSTFSLIFISHDLAVAAELTDRILAMYAGRLIEVGPTRHVLRDARHPYTIALLGAVPSLRGATGDVAAIPGSPPDLVNLPPGCPFLPRCPLATEVCERDDPVLSVVAPAHAVACHHEREARSLLKTEVVAHA